MVSGICWSVLVSAKREGRIRRRTCATPPRAASRKARATGKHWGGRKKGLRPKLTQKMLRSIRALLKEGTPKAEIAGQLHLDRSTMFEAEKQVGTSGVAG